MFGANAKYQICEGERVCDLGSERGDVEDVKRVPWVGLGIN